MITDNILFSLLQTVLLFILYDVDRPREPCLLVLLSKCVISDIC